MTESAAQPETAASPTPKAQPVTEAQTFHDVLRGLLGSIVLCVNAESFEEGGLGYKLDAGWYKGKVATMGTDYLTLVADFKHGTGKSATKERIKQYVPFEKIKRITVMKSQVLIHM